MSNELNPADRELERALASLAPVQIRIDPVACAFQAGRQTGTSSANRWRLIAGALAAAAALQLIPLIARQSSPERRLDSVAAPSSLVGAQRESADPVQRFDDLSPLSHYRLTQTVLQTGVESLSLPTSEKSTPRSIPTHNPFERPGL